MSSSWTTFHPQGPGRPRSGRGPGGAPLLPAALLARLEPDRAGLRQAQKPCGDPPPRAPSPHGPRGVAVLRSTPHPEVVFHWCPPPLGGHITPRREPLPVATCREQAFHTGWLPILVDAYIARASARSGFKAASLTRVGPVPVLAKLWLRLPSDGHHFAQARSGYHLKHRRTWSAIEQRA
jgi:hypothetical protein